VNLRRLIRALARGSSASGPSLRRHRDEVALARRPDLVRPALVATGRECAEALVGAARHLLEPGARGVSIVLLLDEARVAVRALLRGSAVHDLVEGYAVGVELGNLREHVLVALRARELAELEGDARLFVVRGLEQAVRWLACGAPDVDRVLVTLAIARAETDRSRWARAVIEHVERIVLLLVWAEARS
jgi:hypothetical protein